MPVGMNQSIRTYHSVKKMNFAFLFLQLLNVINSMDKPAPDFQPVLQPGKYFITSKWGDLCTDQATGKLVVCRQDESSTIWTYGCFESTYMISSKSGFLEVDFTRKHALGSRGLKISTEGMAATINLEDLTKTTEGIKAHIGLGKDKDTDVNLFLDADRYDTKKIRAYKKRSFPQQQFVFRPVPSVAPGSYFIRSHGGFNCADSQGQLTLCSMLGSRPQEWELSESGNFYLKTALGWVNAGIKDGQFAVMFDKQTGTPIQIIPNGGSLNGDPAFKIKLDSEHYLNDGQDFAFVPSHKRTGIQTNFAELIASSHLFESSFIKFPITSNTIEKLSNEVDSEEFARDAEKAEIFMDASTYDLICKFLTYKKVYGNTVEQAIYAGIKNADAFIDRLIQKRPLVFYGPDEFTLLRGSSSIHSMPKEWALVGQVNPDGSSKEGEIKMADYLTYEEMELAALINVCNATRFINSGCRTNRGSHDFHPPVPGYFLAGVGARFEIPERMEFRHMAKPDYESIPERLATDPLSLMWQQFYGITSTPTESDYTGGRIKLHISAYKSRLGKTLFPMLKQANHLGEIHGLRVVFKLVGFGLGEWAVDKDIQQTLFHQVVVDIIKGNSFEYISRVDMLWMGRDREIEVIQDSEGHRIPLVFSLSNPAEPVEIGELLVASYAWDGNSFAGNEYWAHMLTASGDPAAASCSTIQEMQNPFINKCLTATNNLVIYA